MGHETMRVSRPGPFFIRAKLTFEPRTNQNRDKMAFARDTERRRGEPDHIDA